MTRFLCAEMLKAFGGNGIPMEPTGEGQHLSRISTLWSQVRDAHAGSNALAATAQRSLLDRYGGAIRRYLKGAVRNPDDADELFQEFAYRFLRGRLRGASPERGRFRDFVKGVLYHLIVDFYNGRRKQAMPLPAHHTGLTSEPPSLAKYDEQFLSSWREELLAKSWAALKSLERQTGQLFFSVLRFRADHPEMRSPEMAKELSVQLEKPLTSAGVRQLLHRAREKFADFLLDEVIQSLDYPTSQRLHEELENLNLKDYCSQALERRGQTP